ncbi:succinyl-CoA synthetase subunit alpha [Candidatus Woesearchaeota archaeon]|nr:succinyl-CoA synthetase subunit alpha [Candidatus Woesearchaeota archaeon]
MVKTDYDWYIETDLDEYSGKWIAIENKKVLDSDVRFAVLLGRIKEKYPKARPTFTRITNKLLRLHS